MCHAWILIHATLVLLVMCNSVTYSSTCVLYIDKPDPPTNLTFEYDGLCSSTVSWSSPFTLEGVPLLHEVTITAINTAVMVSSENVTDTEYIFSPVNLNATYIVSLAAWNSAGYSEQTNTTVNFTGGNCVHY